MNELFFIALYLLAFDDSIGVSSTSPNTPSVPQYSTSNGNPWSAGAMELARYDSVLSVRKQRAESFS